MATRHITHEESNPSSSTVDHIFSKFVSNSKKNSILLQRFSAITDDFDDLDDDLHDPLASLSKAKKLCTGNKENDIFVPAKSSIPAANVELLHLLESTFEDDHRNRSSCQTVFNNQNKPENEILFSDDPVQELNTQDIGTRSSSLQETASTMSTMGDMCNPQKFLKSLDQSKNLGKIDDMTSNSKNDANEDIITKINSNNPCIKTNRPNALENEKLFGKEKSSSGFHPHILQSSIENTGIVESSPSVNQYLNEKKRKPNVESVGNDGVQIQGCDSKPLVNLPCQRGNVPTITSHHLWNSQARTTNIRPSFPGPAGLLPSLEEAEKNGSLDYLSAALSSYQEQTSKEAAAASASSISLGPLWRHMLRDLDISAADPASLLYKHNLERSVVQQQSCGGGGALRRVPLLLVQVSGITPGLAQAMLLLHDHTGEVTALMSSSAVERWLPLLCCGSALVLTGATVWRRGPGRPAVLTVTADNVAAVYAPANKDDGDRGSSSCRSANGTLDVTVTSGLSFDERRQLKDTIGLNNILERSLVEENHDFQTSDVRDQGGAPNLHSVRGSLNTSTASNFVSNRSYSGNQNANYSRSNLLNSIRPDFRPGENNTSFSNRPPSNPYRPPSNNNRSNLSAPTPIPNQNILKNLPINSSFKSPNITTLAPPNRFRFSPIVPSPAAGSGRGRTNISPNIPLNTLNDINRNVADASHTRGGICNTPTSRPSAASAGSLTNVHATPLRPTAHSAGNLPSTSTGRFHFKSNLVSNVANQSTGPSSGVSRAACNSSSTTVSVNLNQQGNSNRIRDNDNQNNPSNDSVGLRLSRGADTRSVGRGNGHPGGHVLTPVSNNRNVVTGSKAAINASAVPSDRELKEIRDLITSFADGDFDDF